MKIDYRVIAPGEAGRIKPLWKKLNRIHEQDSVFWKDHYAAFTFEKRMESILMLPQSDLRIETAYDEQGNTVGYCIAVVRGSEGEIESVFVETDYGKAGIGKQLVENSVTWLREKKCGKIELAVACGHESVFAFYERLGFYPRKTILRLKGN